MKRSSLLQCLIGALFAFLFSVSAVGQFITGLELAESVRWFIPWCALFSAVCAALFYFKYGWCTVLLLTAGAGFWTYSNTSVADQLSSLLCKLTTSYQKVYGVKAIGVNKTDEFELALLLIAFLTAAAVSLCICRRKRVWVAFLPAILPFAALLPVTLTVPDALYMYMSIAGIAALLITDLVRRKYPKGFPALTLHTAVAAALAFALLFTLVPEEEYVNRAAKMNDRFESLFESSGSSLDGILGGSGSGISVSQSIDLKNLTPITNLTYTVMTVESTFDGPIYLRGRSYDKYNGISWAAAENRRDTFNSGVSPLGMLTITTSRISNAVYFPYYPAGRTYLSDGFLKNKDNKKKYTFTVSATPVRLNGYVAANTDLPPETYEWASALVTEITDSNMTSAEKIESIRKYVSNSAVYDRFTASMENAGDDFAKWFLFESETGYCAHYATAATVLLRAAGIPARYVEGYFVQCTAGAKTAVTNHRAHAWAEYYDSRSGIWNVLEVTPAEAFYEDMSFDNGT
ncbi:MAG: transglutaminase domain-containing protein, partial [Clostridia bacterium]|nr:transglutaminase domain-containing protein [Clostridia bacterium]